MENKIIIKNSNINNIKNSLYENMLSRSKPIKDYERSESSKGNCVKLKIKDYENTYLVNVMDRTVGGQVGSTLE